MKTNKNTPYIIGCYNKSVVLTYIGVIIAFYGILNISNKRIAIICIILAGMCDLFDGPIARMCKNRTYIDRQFGGQIDSLADIIISVILPALFVHTNYNEVYALPICCIYILAGVIRLAWFNIIHKDGEKHYIGLPVTYMCLILPILYIIIDIWFKLNYASIIMNITMIVVAILFIVNIKIPKPRGAWYLFFTLLAIVSTVIVYY